jgi:hypothetical protein
VPGASGRTISCHGLGLQSQDLLTFTPRLVKLPSGWENCGTDGPSIPLLRIPCGHWAVRCSRRFETGCPRLSGRN